MSSAVSGLVRRTGLDLDEASHHYIVLSFLHRWMVEVAQPAVTGRLLDFGCGGQPYRALLEPRVTEYVTADVTRYGERKIDLLVVPNEPVPSANGSFDCVLSNQVLEHVPDPRFYLGECFRLLRAQGTLILTAPMQWRHHEVPNDYLRFTRFGIINLLEETGFSLLRIDSTGGVFALVGQILANHFSESSIDRPRLFRLINRLFMWLDRRYPDGDDVINWMCIARKPASTVSDGSTSANN
ncbi:methyltransferase domain-containing protein [Bradyrhizobium sp. USDA 4504]